MEGSLEQIAQRYGTDKGTVHSYIEVYEELFSPIRDSVIDLIEVGIKNGGGVKMFRDYFKNATIVGIDDKKRFGISGEDRIVTHIFDAYSDEMDDFLGDRTFDIAIDDGSHKKKDQLNFYHRFKNRIRKGGYLVIEDIWNRHLDFFREEIGEEVNIIDMTHTGRSDNILIVKRF